MDISRIKYLRDALDHENIDLEELSEIETAFAEIPDEELRDLRENATASDMLDELEGRIDPLENSIYEYIVDSFGESEANDPSWSIGNLVAHINNNFEVKEKI